MQNVCFASFVVAAVLVMPCGRAAELPIAPTPRPAGFTPEKAKQALIDLMETRELAPDSRADIKKFATVATLVVKDSLGVADWGPFTLDLAGMRYRFRVGSDREAGFWFMEYEGKFELQNGNGSHFRFR